VVAAFDALASKEPERIRRVNAQGAAEDVTERMLTALADLLP
jgi:thymidylate kinase